MKHVCVEYTDGDYPVQLIQTGFDRFTVQYGKQVKRSMTYAEAGAEFGLCVMHNRTKAEAREAGDTTPYFS